MQELPKLLCCISDVHYQEMLKEKEDKKKKGEGKEEERMIREGQEEAHREGAEGSIEGGNEVCTEWAPNEKSCKEVRTRNITF